MASATKRVVLVTGGLGGIGMEICKRLHADGCHVVAADTTVNVTENGSCLPGVGEDVTQHFIDIRDKGAVEHCLEYVVSLGGDFTGIVNCAGILRHGRIEDISEEGMQAVWDVNVAGMIRVCQAAKKYLSRGASIVNISSITASIGRLPGGGIYGASKAAMEQFTRYLAHELAPDGIRVNALAPGFIGVYPMSPSMRFIANGETDEAASVWLKEQIPLGRLGEAEEMAGPTAFLLSEDASYITGHVLIADGGVAAA